MKREDGPRFPELGFYTLAGHVESPRDMLDELRLAEEMGLGNAFISERLNVKEACALSGACLLYTSPSPRDQRGSRMPSSA